jgi:hypothetical protein
LFKIVSDRFDREHVTDYGMRLKLPLVLMLVVCLAAFLVMPCYASVLRKLSSEELTAEADVIVKGLVKDVASVWEENQTVIYTYVRISVDEYVKGIGSEEITIRQLGGVVDDVGLYVEGAPEFSRDEGVLLYLKQSAGDFFEVLGLSQGKVSVVRGVGNASITQNDYPPLVVFSFFVVSILSFGKVRRRVSLRHLLYLTLVGLTFPCLIVGEVFAFRIFSYPFNAVPSTSQPPFLHWDHRIFAPGFRVPYSMNELGTEDHVVVSAGPDNALDTNPVGDDIAGTDENGKPAILCGPNRVSNTPANNDPSNPPLDDVQVVPVGNSVDLTPEFNAIVSSFQSWKNVAPAIIDFQESDDGGARGVNKPAIRRDGWTVLSWVGAGGDDVQAIQPGQGLPNSVIITAGQNGVLNTVPAGDDQVAGNTITSGANGVADTYKTGDDVQVIPPGQGQPYSVIVTAGGNGLIETMPFGDDVYNETNNNINSGPNGISNTDANNVNQLSAGILAITGLFYVVSTGIILESDILFNDVSWYWRTGPFDLANNMADIQSIATHEIGHSIGVAHTELSENPSEAPPEGGKNDVTPTMYSPVNPFDATTNMRTLEDDDGYAANFLYTPDLGDAPNPYPSKVHTNIPLVDNPATPVDESKLNGVTLYQAGLGAEHIFGYPQNLTHDQFELLGDFMDNNPDEDEALPVDNFDDGVVIGWIPYSSPPTLGLTVIISTSGLGASRYDIADESKCIYLNAWIDWNNNGWWGDFGEKIIGTGGNPYSTQKFAGSSLPIYFIPVPVGVNPQNIGWARFRLDYGEDAGRVRKTDPSLDEYKGAAQFGEVEDYKIPPPPWLSKINLHAYYSSYYANLAMDQGIIDINDRPLSKDWIDNWASRSDIQLRDYTEIGMAEIDINNQNWPTGCPYHKTYDPYTGTFKTYFNPQCDMCKKSRLFRIALQYLTDKNRYIDEILGGLGYSLDLPILPAQAQYATRLDTLYDEYGNCLKRDYSPSLADYYLTIAGFIDTNYDGIRNDPTTGANLEPLKFYIELDNPNLRAAGEELAEQMKALGIPVNMILASQSICHKNVKLNYDYHLYLGECALSPIPTAYYDLYSSHMYYGPDIGLSPNYPGFCHSAFDNWTMQVKYPTSQNAAIQACQKCGEIFANMTPSIPLWSSRAVKAYKTGCQGVVNDQGYGIDNYYSFLNMYDPYDDTIDWGSSSYIWNINPICYISDQESKATSLLYESLMGYNPFNQAFDQFWLAEDYTIGTWTNGVSVHFSLVDKDNDSICDATFHANNGIEHTEGRHVTAEDVAFSLWFAYDCGPRVARNYRLVQDMDHTEVDGDNMGITVYLNHASIYALQNIGTIPIIDGDMWLAANNKYGWGYEWPRPSYGQPSSWKPDRVRSYNPMFVDADGNGMVDLKQDGTGAWCFDEYIFGEQVTFSRYPYYYVGSSDIDTYLTEAFHNGMGDVNEDMKVDISDLIVIARALGTYSTDPPGTGWYQWNSATDLNSDNKVDAFDLAIASVCYGKTLG